MKKWVRILSVALAVLLVCCIGLITWMVLIYKDISNNPLKGFTISGGQSTVVVQKDDKEQTFERTKDVVNILLLGIDSDSTREKQRMGWRSDMIVVCSIDFAKNTMTMISIPRDTRVDMNKLNRNTGEITEKTTNKINAAYGFGGGPNGYGAKNAINCVENFLSCNGKYDVNIDYYASIDLDGIPKITEALGGVEVTLDRDLSGIGRKGETVVINGRQADDYLRNRHTGGGDDGRAARQMEFLMGMAKTIKKKGAKKSAVSLYNEFITFMKTDMGIEEVLALASFADGFDMDQIRTIRLSGTGKTINKTWFYIADEQEVSDVVLDVFYDEKQ